MATIAFFYEVLALFLAASMFVMFVRGVQGAPSPPDKRKKRQGTATGLSVVALIEPGVDAQHCIGALLSQEHANLELVFVVSPGVRLDKTMAHNIESDPRARIVKAGAPPPGWVRRNAAFATGFRATRHEFVLFMDAHVLLRPDALERALALAKQRGTDLLTIFPALTATSRAERLLVPFFLQLTLAGVSMTKINDPESEVAGGFAPFFLFRRAAYEPLGGHAAVRADRFSDSTLAQLVKDRGYRLLVANGTHLAVLQGQDRFGDIWKSWSQSFGDAIDNEPSRAGLLAAMVVAVFAIPWLLVAGAVVALATSTVPAATSPWLGVVIIGSANIILGLLHRRVLRNTLDLDDSLAWLQPLAACIAAGMILGASLRIDVDWLTRFTGRVAAEH